MTTTHLFVELLVIGLGALLWIGGAAAALTGHDPGALVGAEASLGLLFAAVGLTYLFGILVDRAADWAFGPWDRRHLTAAFGDRRVGRERYFRMRRALVLDAPELWSHLEYGRSRLRICRGSALNALLFAGVLTIAECADRPPFRLDGFELVLCDLFLLLLAISCALAWRELNRKEYRKIRRQARWLLHRGRLRRRANP